MDNEKTIQKLTSWAKSDNMIGNNFSDDGWGGTVMGIHTRIVKGKRQYAITRWWYHNPTTILVFKEDKILWREG
jgi:hypothetical protein